MRAEWLAIALLASTTAWAGANVRMKRRPLAVGDGGTATEVFTMDVDLVMSMGPGAEMSGTLDATRTIERTFRVLSTGEGRPFRAVVTYVRAEETQSFFNKEERTTIPVAGHSYEIVLAADDSIVSITEDGAPAPDGVIAFLRSDAAFLWESGLTSRTAAKQKLPVGSVLSDILQQFPGVDGGQAKIDLTLTGKGKAEDGTKIAIADGDVVTEFGHGSLNIRVKGDAGAHVDRTWGFVRQVQIDGPLTVSGEETVDNGMTVELNGKGNVTVDRQTRLER